MKCSEDLGKMLAQYAKKYSNYRYDLATGIVNKVWNSGCGALDLFRVYPRRRVIVVNTVVFNRCDDPKLANLICELEHLYPRSFHRWRVFRASLGYPDYYDHNLSITNAKEDK